MRFFTSCFIFIFLCLLPTSHGCAQSEVSLLKKRYPPIDLQCDAFILKEVVLKMHPAVGIYKSKDYYKKLFDDFITSLQDSLTEKEFRVKTKLLLNELHCGHTESVYSKSFYKEVKKQNWNYSPYIFIPVNEKVYVLANLNRKRDSVLLKGTEIVSINGIKTDSLLLVAKNFISADGYNETAKNHYVQLGFNSYLLGLFSRPDTFEIKYKFGSEIRTHRYAAMKTKALPALPIGPSMDSTLIRKKRIGISYRFLDKQKKSMYLKLDYFSHSGFNRTYKKIFKTCQKNDCENIVIDLRNNGGGSLANSYRLLSYLIDSNMTQTLRTTQKNYPYRKYAKGNLGFKFTRMVYSIIATKKSKHDTDDFVYTIHPNKKRHYENKIFVLINGGSFSASCLVAAYLKGNTRVTFIGEETGGAREGCNAGVTPYYTLPNSQIRIRIPAFRVSNDCFPNLSGHGIMPDYEVKYSFRDILSKKDLELIKVKELLNLKY